MAAATWGNPYVSGAASGRKLGKMSWGSFLVHISVVTAFFPSWCWFILFGHRLHDPKFSNTLQYMSILSRKVVKNELGSNWNDFSSISIKAFIWVLPFLPVPSESVSYQYQFACQTFWLILFPITPQLLFLRSPFFIVYIARLFIDPLYCSSCVLNIQIQLIPNSELTDQGFMQLQLIHLYQPVLPVCPSSTAPNNSFGHWCPRGKRNFNPNVANSRKARKGPTKDWGLRSEYSGTDSPVRMQWNKKQLHRPPSVYSNGWKWFKCT